jgi:hypothetical protein
MIQTRIAKLLQMLYFTTLYITLPWARLNGRRFMEVYHHLSTRTDVNILFIIFPETFFAKHKK